MGSRHLLPWDQDAPAGQRWKCPDCEVWATLGGNAAYHATKTGHGPPLLEAYPPPPATSSPPIVCSTCGFELPDPPGQKYIVVFPLTHGGFRVEVCCDHRQVDTTGAVGVYSSSGCFFRFLQVWEAGLNRAGCDHPAAPEEVM